MNDPTHTFHGQVALVTGAARGIGLAIARCLATKGARVFIADVDSGRGEAAAAELRAEGWQADFLLTDLSLPGGAATMVQAATALAGRLDILVNNARAGRRLSFLEETEGNWDLALGVGLKAAFFAVQAAAPALSLQRGSIINIASVAGVQVTNEAAVSDTPGTLEFVRVLGNTTSSHLAGVIFPS